MRRREFIGLVGGMSVTWAFNATAQVAKRTWHIGVVNGAQEDRSAKALEEDLVQLGYARGKDFTVSLANTVPSPKNYEKAIISA